MKIVHKVCSSLRKHDAVMRDVPVGTEWRCKECPAWKQKNHGASKSGCRMRAEEMVNIVKYGNPWGKKYRHSRRAWPYAKPKGKQ